MKNKDKIRGCLVGGAAGDALGYAVEFDDENEIFEIYGENGITEYELLDGVAQISDDTQMTLFTAAGLLLGDDYVKGVAFAYQDWLKTQSLSSSEDRGDKKTYTWLMDVPELFSLRAPGNTCLDALGSGVMGTIEEPINKSKGCGGVMRVAPVGLFFAPGDCPGSDDGPADMTGTQADMIGARVAAITHGHEMGYIPAATLTHIIRKIVHEGASVEEAVGSAIEAAKVMFEGARNLPGYIELMERAVALSRQDMDDLDAIHALGEGWVGEEALAIAIYCALKYPDDIDRALIAAVNHRGDSDSTGAVAGNIVGANIGFDRIPDKYKNDLELYDVILKVADDLCL